MSVAFRRDSDEEHLEPKFEIPLPAGPNLVTARGLNIIRSKVAELDALVASLQPGQPLDAAKRELRYWHTRQATAQLAPEPEGAVVEFGCTVTFRINGKQNVLVIVGDDEADPARGLISFSAPLARAMMQAEPGELLPFNGKTDVLEILAIEVSR